MKPILIIFFIGLTIYLITEYSSEFFIILAVFVIFVALIALANSKKNIQASGLKFIPTSSNSIDILNKRPKEISLYLDFPSSAIGIYNAEFVVFDVETTGLPSNYEAKPEDLGAWPFVVQFSWAIFDNKGHLIKLQTHIIKPRIPIPTEVANIHKITTEIAAEKGIDPVKAFSEFIDDCRSVPTIIAHNVDFDVPILEAEFIRNGFGKQFVGKSKICTMKSSTQYCRIPKYRGSGYKYPKLTELYGELFANDYRVAIPGTHNSEIDTLMTAKCFFELRKIIDLKTVKGKTNWSPEIKPLIYDPDNDFMPMPDFRKISRKNIKDISLYTRHEYYKKQFIKDWKRLYEPDPAKIGLYGMDRIGYKYRLESSLDKINGVLCEIDTEANRI